MTWSGKLKNKTPACFPTPTPTPCGGGWRNSWPASSCHGGRDGNISTFANCSADDCRIVWVIVACHARDVVGLTGSESRDAANLFCQRVCMVRHRLTRTRQETQAVSHCGKLPINSLRGKLVMKDLLRSHSLSGVNTNPIWNINVSAFCLTPNLIWVALLLLQFTLAVRC